MGVPGFALGNLSSFPQCPAASCGPYWDAVPTGEFGSAPNRSRRFFVAIFAGSHSYEVPAIYTFDSPQLHCLRSRGGHRGARLRIIRRSYPNSASLRNSCRASVRCDRFPLANDPTCDPLRNPAGPSDDPRHRASPPSNTQQSGAVITVSRPSKKAHVSHICPMRVSSGRPTILVRNFTVVRWRDSLLCDAPDPAPSSLKQMIVRRGSFVIGLGSYRICQ